VNRIIIVRIDRPAPYYRPLLLLQRHGRHNTTDRMRSTTSLLFLLTLVKAHGDHSFDLSDEDIGMSYAERHVRLLLYSPLISTLPLALLTNPSWIKVR